jgi:hypothetical protein
VVESARRSDLDDPREAEIMSDDFSKRDTPAVVRRFIDGEDRALTEDLVRHKGKWVAMASRLIARLKVDQASLDGEGAVDLAFSELCRERDCGLLTSIKDNEGLQKRTSVILKRVIHDEYKRSRAIKRVGEGLFDLTETNYLSETGAVTRARPGRGFRITDVDLDSLPSRSHSMEDLTLAKQELDDILDLVKSPILRTIITMRVDGHTRKEIATHMGVTERSIQRKFKIIRQFYPDPRNKL